MKRSILRYYNNKKNIYASHGINQGSDSWQGQFYGKNFYFNTFNLILASYWPIENLLSCNWLYYKKLTRQWKKK